MSGISRIIAVIVLALLVLGIGFYFFPRFGKLTNGEKINWDILSSLNKDNLSTFQEHAFLQNSLEEELKHDITVSLEKMTGPGTVATTVRAQLDLTQEKNNLSQKETHRIASIIKKLSVNVLISGQLSDHKIYQPYSKSDLSKYKEIVKTIIGFDAKRGDKVEVLNTPFSSVHSFFGIPTTVLSSSIVLIILFVLSMFLVIWYVLPLLKNLIQEEPSVVRGQNNLLLRVKNICSEDTEDSAQLLKSWLKDDKHLTPRTYSNAEKAAILILAIGDTIARQIFEYLPKKYIRKISQIILNLGPINGRDVQATLGFFVRELVRPTTLEGSKNRVRDLLRNTLNDQDKTYSEVRIMSTYPSVWDRINKMNPGLVLSFLKKQSPDTIALILFQLSNEFSGKLLSALPKELSERVLIHLSHIKNLRSELREKLSTDVASAFYQFLKTSKEETGSEKIASILKTLSKKERQRLNISIPKEVQDNDWNDLLSLSPAQLRQLLKFTDPTILSLALSDRNDNEKQIFKSLLPQNENLLLEVTPNPDANKARDLLVKTARELNLFG